MEDKIKTWLITGCSSGLGRAFAEAVLKQGYNAVITARKKDDLKELGEKYPDSSLALSLDITDETQILSVVKLAEEKFGSIDVLLNNAGYGYRGAVEEGDDADTRTLFDTMFFGTVSVIKAVLPGMRAKKTGTILNLSSIGGRFAAPGSGYYSAAKFAIEGMSDALRKEVGPLGIRVIVIEPGAFRTDFAGRSLKGTKEIIADYEETVGPRRKENDKSSGTQPGDPRKAAEAIIKVVAAKQVPFRLLLGSDAIKLTRAELESQLKELEEWTVVSVATDYDK
ncbi:oxidoreductase [Pedobacter sp. L105]|uniref:oxidoreductase n=1 Tax=Pedobacter sp. L105 TaxID=1641871 RepID=UPI001C20265E|nr:oxidoreductase [Pedobacter sp. L105]